MSKNNLFQRGKDGKASAPPLWIPEGVWKELHWYAQAFREEVSGLGKCEIVTGGLRIEEIYLLKKGDGSNVEITETELGIFSDQLFRQGVSPRSLCFHWHSHGIHRVSWSRKDEDCIANFLGMAAFWVSAVVDRRGGCLCRLDQERPLRLTVELTPQIILDKLTDDHLAKCLKQAQALSPDGAFTGKEMGNLRLPAERLTLPEDAESPA